MASTKQSSAGKRLTGFPRYMEVLKRDLKSFLLTNLLTIVGFLPFAAGVVLAVRMSNIWVLAAACILGGVFAGPAVSCMEDATLRALRDGSGEWWPTWKKAWNQNWIQSLLPGILLCVITGVYIFMAQKYLSSGTFPGWLILGVAVVVLLIVAMLLCVFWPQVVLFEQPVGQRIKNCIYFILKCLSTVLGVALLELFYWVFFALLLPWSVILLPFLGFWFIIYTGNFLLYNSLDDLFKIEERFAKALKNQTPSVETKKKNR